MFRAAGGKLVDATSEDQKHLKEELDRVEQRFEAVGKDMSKFPAFNFEGKVRDNFQQIGKGQCGLSDWEISQCKKSKLV